MGIVVFLPDVPVQCTPILFGEGCLGQWFWRVGGVFGCSLELADMGEMGRAALGGQSGVAWSWPLRQHTQKGRLAMRLCVGRNCGLWSIPMVKLVSGAGSPGTGVGSGIGCSC